MAQRIQQAFLPKAFPTSDALQFGAYCRSARKVTGDFYDVLPLPGQKHGLVLGDVCGKGMAAALYMARVISYFRAVATLRRNAEDLLPYVNRFLAGEWSDRTFATACMIVVQMRRAAVSVYSAGHMPPYLLREKDGSLCPVDVKSGFPLGVDKDCRFGRTDLTLEKGDTLVLYTDGVTDATNARGEMFGFDRLEHVLRSHKGSPTELTVAVAEAVNRFSGEQPQSDDQTLLVVRKS